MNKNMKQWTKFDRDEEKVFCSIMIQRISQRQKLGTGHVFKR